MMRADTADHARTRIATPVRIARNLVLAILAFWGTTLLLRPGFTDDRILQAKLDFFRAHKDDYDSIFFGSSRIYRAFDPRAFSKALPGETHRSFNFGIGSMRPHELNSVLERILALEPRRLKYVFIEVMDWHPTVLDGMQSHERTIAWHDLSETSSALLTSWKADIPWPERIAAWNAELADLARHYGNVGEGVRWWRGRELPAERQAYLQKLMASADGFVALDQEVSPYYAARRRIFLERYREIFLEQIALIAATNRQKGSLAHLNVGAFLDQQAFILDRGIAPVYVIPNVRWGTPDLNELQGPLRNFMSFNHPLRYPELYDERNYFDRGHLTQSGATEFSRALAEQFRTWQRTAQARQR